MQSLKFNVNKRKALAEMLGVIILLAITVVAGAFVYEIFFNKGGLYSNVSTINIQDGVISNNEVILTIKNTGTTSFTSMTVTAYQDGSSTTVANPTWTPAFGTAGVAPGTTVVYMGTITETVGASYLIVVTATSPNGGTVESTITITGT